MSPIPHSFRTLGREPKHWKCNVYSSQGAKPSHLAEVEPCSPTFWPVGKWFCIYLLECTMYVMIRKKKNNHEIENLRTLGIRYVWQNEISLVADSIFHTSHVGMHYSSFCLFRYWLLLWTSLHGHYSLHFFFPVALCILDFYIQWQSCSIYLFFKVHSPFWQMTLIVLNTNSYIAL